MKMTEGKASIGRGLRVWVLGALGALVVGLAAVWVNYYFGPVTPQPLDPCAIYTPPDADYIREVLNQAEADVPAAREATRRSVEIRHFLVWVLDCGTAHRVYGRDLGYTNLRVNPFTPFRDRKGKECRELSVSQTVDGRWQGSSELYCRSKGKWELAIRKAWPS